MGILIVSINPMSDGDSWKTTHLTLSTISQPIKSGLKLAELSRAMNNHLTTITDHLTHLVNAISHISES